jgi:putative ABC transport system permease protein
VTNGSLASGRMFSLQEQQAGAAVCAMGETVRRELYGGTVGLTGLGEALRVRQFSCKVVDILAAKGQGGMGDQDDAVLLPLHTLQRRVTGTRKVSFMMVSTADGVDSDATWLRTTTTTSTSSTPSNWRRPSQAPWAC